MCIRDRDKTEQKGFVQVLQAYATIRKNLSGTAVTPTELPRFTYAFGGDGVAFEETIAKLRGYYKTALKTTDVLAKDTAYYTVHPERRKELAVIGKSIDMFYGRLHFQNSPESSVVEAELNLLTNYYSKKANRGATDVPPAITEAERKVNAAYNKYAKKNKLPIEVEQDAVPVSDVTKKVGQSF